jgi:hypothetical protein
VNRNRKAITPRLTACLIAVCVTIGFVLEALAQPVITTQPLDQTVSLFADATFRVTVTGDAPLSYQWQFNEINLLGQTNAILTVTNVQGADAGQYAVVVTNLSGSVTSQVATLTITPFNSIFFFGFSWTGTSGLAPGGSRCPWTLPKYYEHRACNGPMWPEFLSTNLGLAYLEANNFGECGATVFDILSQETRFKPPAKPQLSLYCLWVDSPAGAVPDVFTALTNQAAADRLLRSTILNSSNLVNRLYLKGARQILIELDADWSYLPQSFLPGSATNTTLSSKYREYVARYYPALVDAMSGYIRTRPDLRLLIVDLFSKSDQVLAHPADYGFTKTKLAALNDTNLTNMAFDGPGADYVWWDDSHCTSKFHRLIAEWHLAALRNSVLEQLKARPDGATLTVEMNYLQIGRDYALQKSPDLRTWTDVRSFTAVAGTNQWSMGAAAEPAFFRLTWRQ